MSKSTVAGRGTQVLAAFAIVSTFLSGPFATVASAEPVAAGVQQAVESTAEQRADALRLVGLRLTPENLQLSDRNFVIHIWSNADERRFRHVREAAVRAYRQQEADPESCYRFIVRDIHAAHAQDVRAWAEKAERDQQWIKAAEVVGWTGLTEQDLDVTLENFVLGIWQRAAENSQVRAKAQAVLTPESTDEQRTRYVVTDIFVARDADRENPPR